MSRLAALKLSHLQGVYGLLDDLQAGFVLLDAEGNVAHASYWLRGLLPRNRMKGDGVTLLGRALYDELCVPVLQGMSSGERWREVTIEGRDGAIVEVSVRSTAVEWEPAGIGVLLSMHDRSSEIGLHKQNKALLEKQKRINDELRIEIARQVREHEDDIAQLNEILQIAPAIFASFMVECTSAIDLVEKVVEEGAAATDLVDTLRELHTLKGNARSLGLNFIGGRAHSVEERLLHVQKRLERGESMDAADLPDLLEDLRRARDRASFVRSRLSAQAAEPVLDTAMYRRLADAELALGRAVEALPEGSPAREELAATQAMLAEATSLPLQELFEYLKAAVAAVSQSSGRDCPVVECHGGGMPISPRLYHGLAHALPHLARNAVTHGIETAAERLDLGKAATGTITIEARVDGDQLLIRFGDDGRGLDRERLFAIAREKNLPIPRNAAELAELLLSPGVSTADVVTMDKGRGMGTSAARQAVTELGGSIAVESSRGLGTTFQLRIPLRS